jgi:hypothetical protein
VASRTGEVERNGEDLRVDGNGGLLERPRRSAFLSHVAYRVIGESQRATECPWRSSVPSQNVRTAASTIERSLKARDEVLEARTEAGGRRHGGPRESSGN